MPRRSARGDLHQALDLLRYGADRFADVDNARGAAAALRHLADLAIVRGRYDDAIAALREVLTGLDANAAAGITSMAQLGCLCAIQGRSGEADQWHARALAAAENQQHLPLLAFACNAKGLTLRRRGRLAEAEQCHQRALRISRERGVPAALAMAHASLGYIAELRNDARRRVTGTSRPASTPRARRPTGRPRPSRSRDWPAPARLRDDPEDGRKALGGATALRQGSVVTAVGAATAQRGIALGHLDRVDIDRTIARVGGLPRLRSRDAEGLRDPQAVLTAVRVGPIANVKIQTDIYRTAARTPPTSPSLSG